VLPRKENATDQDQDHGHVIHAGNGNTDQDLDPDLLTEEVKRKRRRRAENHVRKDQDHAEEIEKDLKIGVGDLVLKAPVEVIQVLTTILKLYRYQMMIHPVIMSRMELEIHRPSQV